MVGEVPEILSDGAESFVRLIRIIEHTRKMLSAQYGIEPEFDESGYGFHLSDQQSGENLLYLGIRYVPWMVYGNPLYLGVNKSCRRGVYERLSREPSLLFDNDWLYYRISMADLISEEDSVGRLYSLVDRILNG